MSFTDDDLKRLKEDPGYWWGSFSSDKLSALLARLEAAEQVIVDITHPDKGFLDGPHWRREHYEAWRLRWAVKWHVGIVWHDCKPLLFQTRREARVWIKKEYVYIKTRKDLRDPPLKWRMPKAVRVEVILRELK